MLKSYILLFSLFRSYKLYATLIFVLFVVLLYTLLSIKSIQNMYQSFYTYQYGFTPDIAIYVNKESNLSSIIKSLSNLDFKYKKGAIKKIQNTKFTSNNFTSFDVDIVIMGLYFDKKSYISIVDNHITKQCKILKINSSYIYYNFIVSNCNIEKKIVSLKIDNQEIPLKVIKKKNHYKLKTTKMDNESAINLYRYLENILNEYDDSSLLGINPPPFLNQETKNKQLLHTLQYKKRLLRDYFGIIFSNNSKYTSTLISENLYKNISWAKQNIFRTDINSSVINLQIFVHNYFSSNMKDAIVLTKYDHKIFKDNYQKFIFFYTKEPLKIKNALTKKYGNMEIKYKKDLLRQKVDHQKNVSTAILVMQYFIYIITFLICFMSLNKFYQKFKKPLLLAKSFNSNVYIYTLFLTTLILLAFILSYFLFYMTLFFINIYLQTYFYPILIFSVMDIIDSLLLVIVLLLVILLASEIKLHKGLTNEN